MARIEIWDKDLAKARLAERLGQSKSARRTYERQWEESELESLHITASIFGSAETRVRTEQRLIRRQQDLTLLQEIVAEALRARTLRQMASDIVGRLAALINATHCFITQWDESNAQTFPLAAHGMNSDTYLSLQPVSN